MTISEPKFHAGQYVFYDGDVHRINKVLGFQLSNQSMGTKEGWYYEIMSGDKVRESCLSGDVNTEYDRMQRRVLKMEEQLEDMLKRYQDYLHKIDNLIKSKEA